MTCPIPSVHCQWAHHFLNKLDLSQHASILEIGCRKGKISAHMADTYPKQQFISIDNQDAYLQHTHGIKSPNLEFVHQDARHLALDQSFDAVISVNNCLMWIQEKQLVLNEIARVLKPGGRAYLQFFVRHGYPKNDRFLSHIAQHVEWSAYFKRFTPDYYDVQIPFIAQLIFENGLIVHRLDLNQYTTHFEHSDQLHEFFKSWATQKKYLPLPKHDHFFHQTTEHYLSTYHYDLESPFDYPEYVLETILEKPYAPQEHRSHFQFGSIIFTQREAQVIKQFLKGYSAKEIAHKLDLSPKTVEFYLAKIKEKCQCSKRSELFEQAHQKGFSSLVFDPLL